VQKLSVYLAARTSKVGRTFVGETEQCQRMITSAFALCTSRLVKLTQGPNFTNILKAAFAPIFLRQKCTNTNVQNVSTNKLCANLWYEKAAGKILVKLTPDLYYM
jgi:hypothetical protein